MDGLTTSPSAPCPLCDSRIAKVFHRDRKRDYLRCGRCQLVYIPPQQYPSREQEAAEYALHQNCPDDPRYRCFLNRLVRPLNQCLAPGSVGLDFGSGPGPALSVMFSDLGHTISNYDPIFCPEPSVFYKQYDFICATEVVEHLHRPGHELRKLWSLLKPGGWLGIMTKLALDASSFSRWHYRNDPTHVVFFSQSTFQWLAEDWRAKLFFVCKDVILIQKPSDKFL